MKERIITGLLLVVFVFAGLVYANDYLFGVGVFLVAMLSAYEWLKFTKISQQETINYLVIFMIVLFVVSEFFVYIQYIFPVFWLYAIYRLSGYERQKFDTLSVNEMLILGLFAISPFAASLYVLHSNSVAWIFMFILVVAGADSGAYFTGKAMGKRKMLPRLSPNKTIEGLLGGMACAVIIAIVFLLFMNLSIFEYLSMVIISALIAVLSVVGDVFESMMKRIAGVKDSGNILPGHGGVLDRLDGYMPALPIFVTLGYLAGVFVV
ncbi:phosphatidate cytidylyltransferase [Francisella philomiragia]|uniref:Phosphatidate cytidylyltransferase n=1 Tax=Francisella philomiragia subsp. philomiragia (strain ATCC 25017 / CCUG 19701 / FSC 153 / O\|nr:phosphatidate cytidylyltransferase [Francisella philomiragia]AJI47916.1 cytidylyltransferase family protein [Francisella philomiragia]AJI48861.1 cytidylyltransferase family protein [Francisella philomiragia]AJI54609.1 cytidylyltransferase family protein [Francisella philomiragia]MBK2019726.1 phosphatidate cytidylyltransferase [Francisella philomiragia]MBK2025670.1 phosphatidate cytidylyltransferase [Francisella philomiragia]